MKSQVTYYELNCFISVFETILLLTKNIDICFCMFQITNTKSNIKQIFTYINILIRYFKKGNSIDKFF